MTTDSSFYLVNAGNDCTMASVSNDYSFPALGVLALGTWLRQKMPDLEVTVRDGAVRSVEQIVHEIQKQKPVLVGVSTLCTSYQNSLTIARAAKDCGAQVVFGNDQASQTSRLILENQPTVDYVIGAEYGELPLELLVRHIRGEEVALECIPSLTYRLNDSVVGFDFEKHKHLLSITSPFSGYRELLEARGIIAKRQNALDIFPIVDRTLYPSDHWEAYLRNYNARFAKLHASPVTGVTTMNRARGCSRQDDDKCKHCDMLLDISQSSPELFWEEVRAAHAQVNATSFYEACDSFSSFPHLIEKIVCAKPRNLGFDPEFYVYAQAIDLANHPERIDLLKEMGVFRINMGLESMSNKTLKHMKGEKDSVDINSRAIQLLKDKNINVYASFVLGSEAETSVTLHETVTGVCDLIKGGYLCDAEAQPVLPLYGNYQGRQLNEQGLMTIDPAHPDWPLNVEELSQVYINTFSGVSHQDCVDAAKEIRRVAKEHRINFGSGVSQEGSYA